MVSNASDGVLSVAVEYAFPETRHAATCSDAEKERIQSLMSLVPATGKSALDVGCRGGFLSRLLAQRFDAVTALDLEKPEVRHEKISCVAGDVTRLGFDEGAFEFVLCSEVLEHISPAMLNLACSELACATNRYLLIGVPYRQDIRVGRTTCRSCGRHNPPWGHVNRFDERKLKRLFPGLTIRKLDYVGENRSRTNALSSFFMDLAGNPYGTYNQEEVCIHCGEALTSTAGDRELWQKVLTRSAAVLQNAQSLFTWSRPNWIHVLFEKQRTGGSLGFYGFHR